MRKPLVSFICLLFIAATAFAQKNFLPGYIILSSKDTVKGFIDYRNWQKNPSQVSFSKDSKSAGKEYSANEIEGFTIDNTDLYVKASVSVDGNPVEATYTGIAYKPELVKKETIFLRVLSRGSTINFFEYIDSKPHYYFQKDHGTIEELIYKADATSSVVRYIYTFRDQLNAALLDKAISSKEKSMLTNLDYKARDFVKFSNQVNDTKSGIEGMGKKKVLRFFVGAGLGYSSLTFTSESAALNSLKFDNNVSYCFTGGMDLLSARNMQNLVIRLEVLVNEFHFKGAGESETYPYTYSNEYSLKQMNFTPALSLLYNIIRSQSAKIYIGASAGHNFRSYSEHTLTSTNHQSMEVKVDKALPDFEKGWGAYYARAGVFLGKNLEAGVSVQLNNAFLSNTGTKGKPVFLKLSYLFGN